MSQLVIYHQLPAKIINYQVCSAVKKFCWLRDCCSPVLVFICKAQVCTSSSPRIFSLAFHSALLLLFSHSNDTTPIATF